MQIEFDRPDRFSLDAHQSLKHRGLCLRLAMSTCCNERSRFQAPCFVRPSLASSAPRVSLLRCKGARLLPEASGVLPLELQVMAS